MLERFIFTSTEYRTEMRVLLICVLVNVAYVYSTIAKYPKNTAVFAGDRMELECQTDYTVRQWAYIPKGSSSIQVILAKSNDYRIQIPAFGANVNANGSGLIYLNRTLLEHGGNYRCLTKTTEEETHCAQLTVIESWPEFSVVKNNSNHIQIKCSINYTGNWAPRMKCSLRNETFMEIIQLNASDPIKIENSNKSRIISTLDTYLNVTGSSFTVSCKIFFENLENQSCTSASNIPDFNYVWNSTTYNFSNLASDGTNPPQNPTTTIHVSSTPWNSNGTLIIGATVAGVVLVVLIGIVIVCIQRTSKKDAMKTVCKEDAQPECPDVLYSNVNKTTPQGDIYANVDKPNKDASKKKGGGDIYAEVNKPKKSQKKKGAGDIYAEVSKPKKGATKFTVQSNAEEAPIYSAVNKDSDDKKSKAKSGGKGSKEQTLNSDPETIEYLDLNGVKDLCEPKKKAPPKPETTMFNQSEYAAIDHFKSPPPLPPNY